MNAPLSTPRLELAATVHCSNCGGQNLRADAYAEWNPDLQLWELSSIFDARFCNDCGHEVTGYDREIEGRPAEAVAKDERSAAAIEESPISVAERQSDRIKEAISDVYVDAETTAMLLSYALCDLRHFADRHRLNFATWDEAATESYAAERVWPR